MADTLGQALTAAEQDVADEVRTVLDELADEIAAALLDATEIVAARFSLGRIATMWSARVPRIMRRLFRVAETAGEHAAGDVDAELPDDWQDLPARYDAGTLPPSLGDYAEQTDHLLRAVGDRLTEAAVKALAEGLDAGEDTEQLRTRLRALFAADSAQLGAAREDLIARTEAGRAWNGATLAAAQDLTGPDRPLVKQWQTRRDTSVRDAHDAVDGQIQFLDDPFTVADVPMNYPGDPSAPPALVCNCRCVLRLQRAEATAAAQVQGAPPTAFSNRRETTVMAADSDDDHKRGGMIALLPSAADAERLAFQDGEDADELHCTLMFLGDEGADWTDDQRAELIAGLTARMRSMPGPIPARLFGVNCWNPGSDKPAWVWATGDDTPTFPALLDAHALAVEALEDTHDRPAVPEQHSPWAAHVTGVYTSGTWPLAVMTERVGEITFDRLRVAFGGQHTDIPLGPEEETDMSAIAAASEDNYRPPVRTWTTPGDAALAYENQQTGDGRVFTAGSVYWDGPGPWPLQYADEMGMGHDGAELAGAIQTADREDDRIIGSGVLYMTQEAGWEAVTLLEQEAPLGVSVDLDDVSMELVDNAPGGQDNELVLAAAFYARASVLRVDDDSWVISASTPTGVTAAGTAMARTSQTVLVISNENGRLPADAAHALFPDAGLTAAAGDADDPEVGVVVHAENSGDYLMRITRARFRGATLVAMPAYDKARIVLDPEPAVDEPVPELAEDVAAAAAAGDVERVVAHVCGSPVPLSARQVAAALGLTVSTTKRHLRAAVRDGRVLRIARGQYAAPSTIPEGEMSAAGAGDLSLPVHENRDAAWDPDAAGARVLEWATDEEGTVDPDRLGRAFLWRDPDADPTQLAAYALGYADVYSDDAATRLETVAEGVYAAGDALMGDSSPVPADERETIRERVDLLYAALADEFDDPSIQSPWDSSSDDDALSELEASAWQVMQKQPPMPAAWFAEPTLEELPPGSGGVHFNGGRVYGWVAQTGVPHAVHGRKIQIEKLGRLDMSHFLRAKFSLDNGQEIAVGTVTMNVGHHRDGWQCETASCQFDDSGTVAGIVTVGQNDGGLWFSGAAAPWLSEWDLTVFRACQPSYHMTQGSDGRWQLKAVLTVPVPAHSSPLEASDRLAAATHLAATAVVERSNLALTAAAANIALEAEAEAVAAAPAGQPATGGEQPPADMDALAALLTPTFLDTFAAALEERQQQRATVRAEVEALTALVDPAGTGTPVSAAPQQERN
ncbi:phage minor head protein [[Kitasatospora] papulosa]|uniref:phage minor head protein n=1 Tax=[Kitasatospora] papulosa TaxID=1464011 RepID=UPI00369D454C